MAAAGYNDAPRLYAAVIAAWSRAGRAEQAEHWLLKMEARGMNGDLGCFRAVVLAWARAGQPAQGEEWLRRMHASGVQIDVGTVNLVVEAWAGQQPERAEDLVWAMQQLDLQPDARSFDAVLDSYNQAGLWEKVMSTLYEMNQAGVPRNVMAYEAGVSACLHLHSDGGHQAKTYFKEGDAKLAEAGRTEKWPRWRDDTDAVYDFNGASLDVCEVALSVLLEDMVLRPAQRRFHPVAADFFLDCGERTELFQVVEMALARLHISAQPVDDLGLVRVEAAALQKFAESCEVESSRLRADSAPQFARPRCFAAGARVLDASGRSIDVERAWGASVLTPTGHALVVAVHKLPAYRRDIARITVGGGTFTVTNDHRVPGRRTGGQGEYQASELGNTHVVRCYMAGEKEVEETVVWIFRESVQTEVVYLEVAGDKPVYLRADDEDVFLLVLGCERPQRCVVNVQRTFVEVRTTQSEPAPVSAIEPPHACENVCIKFVKGECERYNCPLCHHPIHKNVILRHRPRPRRLAKTGEPQPSPGRTP
jgi:pentatricopeptide repeat protein